MMNEEFLQQLKELIKGYEKLYRRKAYNEGLPYTKSAMKKFINSQKEIRELVDKAVSEGILDEAMKEICW
jgi:HEPN domain-containing protein